MTYLARVIQVNLYRLKMVMLEKPVSTFRYHDLQLALYLNALQVGPSTQKAPG